jgi:orotidine-5'-phosphate decarboxylase
MASEAVAARANIQIPAKERLIVALDVPTVEDARALVRTLGDSVSFYKIGMQLQFAGGIQYAQDLIGQGKKVFLDSKLFDIDATIEKAAENIARMGVTFLTVHGIGATVRAAVRGRGDSKLQILAVTVLTSLEAADLHELGYRQSSIEDIVLYRARKALDAGADGVIASGHEAEAIGRLAAGKLKIVTPGIRRGSDDVADQKRVATPGAAIRSGADYLVVGRPISQAEDPKREAEAIVEEVEAAVQGLASVG